MLRSRFDTFAMVVSFIDEVRCHNGTIWSTKHNWGNPSNNHETFISKISING